MIQSVSLTRNLGSAWPFLRLLAFRILCGAATAAAVDVAAAVAQARHAGWVAACIGIPLGLLVAYRVRDLPAGLREFALPPVLRAPMRLVMLLAIGSTLGLIVLAPLLATRLPPFDDYLNHLALSHLIAADSGNPLAARFYAIHWAPIPNLAMHLVVPALAQVLGIFAAGKLFLIAATLMLLAGPFAIQAALYRALSPAPLVAGLFAQNYVAKMGVANYQFGTGLALFGIAAWIALRRAPAWQRGLVSAVWVLALFFCHLMALGLYGLAIGSFELWMLAAEPPNARHFTADAAALALPFMAALGLLIAGRSGEAALIPSEWGGLHARLDGLRMLVQSYDSWPDLLFLGGLIAGFVWAVRRGAVALHPAGWVFLAVAGVAFLLLPNRIMGTWGAASRLPTGMAFVLSGALSWELPSRRAQRGLVLALAALLLLRTATAEAAFRRYDRVRADVEASLRLIAPGSRVLVAEDYSHDDDALRAIRQLPCLALIERSSLVSLEYSDPHGDVLIVKPPYRASAGGFNDDPVALPELLAPPPHDAPPMSLPFDPSGRIYWADWPHSYDYVYVLNRQGEPSPAPERLELLYDGERVQLFRVRQD
jgi:hypothetical protein